MRLLARHAIRLLGQENSAGEVASLSRGAIRLKATTGYLNLATASVQPLEPEKQVLRKVSTPFGGHKVSVSISLIENLTRIRHLRTPLAGITPI